MSELILKGDLPSQASDIKNNEIRGTNGYFPIRAGDRNKKGMFDWGSVIGHVVKTSYRKILKIDKKELSEDEKALIEDQKKISPEEYLEIFKHRCKAIFLNKLDEEDFWPVLEEMYFKGEELYKISPQFLLFKLNKKNKGTAASERLSNVYTSLLADFIFEQRPKSTLNFLEQQLFQQLEQVMKSEKDTQNAINEAPYLPFMSRLFQQDLQFLGQRPKYMLSVLPEYLKLYGHLYASQFALNLRGWRAGEPTSKPNYFILDSERASDERTLVKNNGYKQIHSAFYSVFPYVSMNETLQSKENKQQPLWALAKNIAEYPGSATLLNNFAEAFKDRRDLDTILASSNDPLIALDDVLKLASAQFKRGETRHEINNDYVKTIQSELCGDFIQRRGRAGNVLVLNQDYLLLLTNLSIGEQPNLRFHELIKAFESRGVYFDKQSQQLLIEFYERIGNVERMSDSGDAVYVSKTV